MIHFHLRNVTYIVICFAGRIHWCQTRIFFADASLAFQIQKKYQFKESHISISQFLKKYNASILFQGFMNIRWSKWKRVLLTRSIAMVPTIIVALIATNDLDAMNNWLNVLQSVQLPFALLPVLHFTSSETIMREFKNGR